MDRIAIAGVSIHDTDVSGLGRVRRPEDDVGLRDLADALGASELVFIATCNRVEVVYACEEGEPPTRADLAAVTAALDGKELGEAWHHLTGREAVRHLFRVAASLDSLVLGEDQILAQVREAYGRASDIGLVGPLLGPLFHHALAIGKKVRADTELSRHPVSVVSLAVGELQRRSNAASLVVAVVGAGRMGSLLGRVLCDSGLAPAVVVNRSPARAARLAGECGARVMALDEFRRGAFPVDVIFSATSAPGLVFDEGALARLAALTPTGLPLHAIDLAVPADIAETAGDRVVRIDIDDLRSAADSNRALREQAAEVAARLVDEKVEVFARRLGEAAAALAVTDLTEVSNEILERELTGLLTGRLSHLADDDRRAVERWARATFKRLLHLPVSALKRLATDMWAAEHDARGDGR